MKKVMVILILAVFIASIAVVNFMGILPVPKDSTNYVKSIWLESVNFLGENNIEIKPRPLGTNDLYTFEIIASDSGKELYEAEDNNNPNVITLTYKVSPTNATEKGVEVICDSDIAYYHDISDSLIFLKPGMITVTIKALDGHGASTTVTFWARSAEDQQG